MWIVDKNNKPTGASPPRGITCSIIEANNHPVRSAYQPPVLFSQNEPATSNQPQPASSTLLSEQTSTSHQPPANRTG
jgi:hypothetical protein